MLRSQGYGTCRRHLVWELAGGFPACSHGTAKSCRGTMGIPPEALDKWRHPPFLDAFPSTLPCLLTQVPYPEHDHRRELNEEFRSETRSR